MKLRDVSEVWPDDPPGLRFATVHAFLSVAAQVAAKYGEDAIVNVVEALERKMRTFGFVPVTLRINPPSFTSAGQDMYLIGVENPEQGWDADGAPVGSAMPRD